jgi:hypothetical protein
MGIDISYSPRRGPAPQAAFISACEALTWIAWGEAKTNDDIMGDSIAVVMRWGTAELSNLLEALEARAAPSPYHLVVPQFSLDPRISPNGPGRLRAIRARARKRLKRLVSYGELATELRAEITASHKGQILLQGAAADMMEALRAGKITAFGQRRHPAGAANPGAIHEAVPIEVLIHPAVTLKYLNELGVDMDADFKAREAHKGQAYDDVRFKTAEVLALWPSDSVSDRTGSPGRPTSSHLVLSEFQRRAEAGEAASTITDEGKALVRWLAGTYPALAQMKSRTAENIIRSEFHRRRGRTKL